MAGFPTAPLIHHQLINYPLPSSIYYEARLGSLWRNLGREGRPADIVQEHLDRALRTWGMDATVAQPLRIQEASTKLIMATIGSMDYYKVWRARSYTSIVEVPQPYLPQRARLSQVHRVQKGCYLNCVDGSSTPGRIYSHQRAHSPQSSVNCPLFH